MAPPDSVSRRARTSPTSITPRRFSCEGHLQLEQRPAHNALPLPQCITRRRRASGRARKTHYSRSTRAVVALPVSKIPKTVWRRWRKGRGNIGPTHRWGAEVVGAHQAGGRAPAWPALRADLSLPAELSSRRREGEVDARARRLAIAQRGVRALVCVGGVLLGSAGARGAAAATSPSRGARHASARPAA